MKESVIGKAEDFSEDRSAGFRTFWKNTLGHAFMKDDPRAYRKYTYADEDMCQKMITRKIKERFKVSAVESELKGSEKGDRIFRF